MNNPNIGFVRLYRPGRLTIIFAITLLIAMVATYMVSVQNEVTTGWYIFAVLILSPFVIAVIDVLSRRWVLPLGSPRSDLASQLKKLKLKWVLRKSGRGCKRWNRNDLGLPRTIADCSLEKKLESVAIPQDLIEPERILTSKPGSMLGCLLGAPLCLLIAIGLMRVAWTSPGTFFFSWIIAALFLWNALRLVLGLPIVHRSRKLPEMLRRIGRGRILSRSFVVGPGWVKYGRKVWRADRDMLLIRRTGFRPASAEIDCLFAGPEARRRMTFSGVGDDDFHLLFGRWNVDDVRLEFIDSDLS